MNIAACRELWERLRNAGLVEGDVPLATSSPWYIKAMLGVAGWMGAFFILSFFGLALRVVLENSTAAALAGITCCAIAYFFFRFPYQNDFTNQFGLAMGLVGQALFGMAIVQHFHSETALGYFILFCFEVALTVIMPNFIHRFFTTILTVVTLFIWFSQVGLSSFVLPLTAAGCAIVWRGEIRLAALAKVFQPIGYGLAVGVLIVAVTTLFEKGISTIFQRDVGGVLQLHSVAIGTALTCIVFLGLVIQLLRSLDISISGNEGLTVLFCTAAIMGASFLAHGLAPACLLLILGFAGGNRVLLGLGIIALIFFLSCYYYQLSDTLLMKSFILGITGMLLLIARWALRKLFPPSEEQEYA